MSWFLEASQQARITLPRPGAAGLRVAQLGAAWAIAASFTSGRPTAALAVMPTGTGKSTVLMLVPLLVPRRNSVLVAAPSRVIRDQLAESFRTQEILVKAGILPGDHPLPSVRVISHRPGSDDEWIDAVGDADVAVGTLGVLSPAYQKVSVPPRGLFSTVLVDEAHHSPAATWAALLAALGGTNRALLTATPVRTDRSEIQAELVYTYSLADALRDGVIAPITFVPVQIPDGMQRDLALARAAASRLADPLHRQGQSLILVRTSRVDDAYELKNVYAGEGLVLAVVTSRTAPSHVREILRQAEAGEIHGLVSVGVLGEGLDIPRVKIAVYHRKHQSLPATLQFAGRIVRTGTNLGPAELLAVPDEDVGAETRALYENDSDWAKILSGLADAAVDDERERRRFFADLADVREGKLLPEPLSAAAVRASRDVIVFKTDPMTHSGLLLDRPISRISGGDVVLDRLSPDGRMRVLIAAQMARPEWLSSDSLDTEIHSLYIAVLDPESALLFVHAKTDNMAAEMASRLGLVEPQPESTGWIARFLAGLRVLSYFSVGMRATRLPGGTIATYRTLAGTSVGTAVSASESIIYAAGHLILTADNPFGDGTASTSVGVSMRRAKVWAPGRADLLGFRRWCERVGVLGRTPASGAATAPHLGLRIPQALTEFPDRPLVAHPDNRLLLQQPTLVVQGRRLPIAALELIPTKLSAHRLMLKGLCEGSKVLEAEVDLSGKLTPTAADPGVKCRFPGAVADVLLVEALEAHGSLTFYYADASSSVGPVLNTAATSYPPFPSDALLAETWQDVDIFRESKPGRGGKINVQEAMVRWHVDREPPGHGVVVINDDGSGEIADLVVLIFPPALLPLLLRGEAELSAAELATILSATEHVNIVLVHCKWAGSDKPRRDLGDIDQLVGQAHRSARWLVNPASFWRVLAERVGGRAQVKHGDPIRVGAALSLLANNTPASRFEVQLVQPGLDIAQVAGWEGGELLLSFCNDALAAAGTAFSVVGS